jgi:hypothetical protein
MLDYLHGKPTISALSLEWSADGKAQLQCAKFQPRKGSLRTIDVKPVRRNTYSIDRVVVFMYPDFPDLTKRSPP